MMSSNRKKYHDEYMSDIVCDISQSSYWRKLLFDSEYDQKFLISNIVKVKLTKYILDPIEAYDLKYYVSKVKESPEEFDEGLIIFKFESCEFPEITSYSGNNEGVI